MGVKEYELPNGRKVVFEFDENGVGKITLEAMDLIMGMVNIDIVRCGECRYVMKLRSESAAKKFGQIYECRKQIINSPNPSRFCSYGERRTDDSNKSTRRTYGGLQEM